MTQSTNEAQRTWTHEKDFADEESGIVVRLQRKQNFRPLFSALVVRIRDDGRSVPFLPIFVKTENAQVKSVTDPGPIIAKLSALASEYVRETVQARESEIIDEKLRREQSQLDKEKPKQAPGLKKIGKLDAKGRV